MRSPKWYFTAYLGARKKANKKNKNSSAWLPILFTSLCFSLKLSGNHSQSLFQSFSPYTATISNLARSTPRIPQVKNKTSSQKVTCRMKTPPGLHADLHHMSHLDPLSYIYGCRRLRSTDVATCATWKQHSSTGFIWSKKHNVDSSSTVVLVIELGDQARWLRWDIKYIERCIELRSSFGDQISIASYYGSDTTRTWRSAK